jgi:16S rRNA G1207 methylase RsmC
MTKHFSPQLLKITSKYFETTNQTKAWKKSRLILLSNPTKKDRRSHIRLFKSKYGDFSQYKGVFSSGHIDYATQFLIENIDVPDKAQAILDLASGNGILAKIASQKSPNSTIHLVDDSFLAVESSKLNLKGKQFKFHHNYNLQEFSNNYFDYIISNPPFHLEHEIDLSLPTTLFKQACRVLKPNGVFELVANRHLMYKPILNQLFKTVEIKAQNSKFIVYKCTH